MLKSLLLGAVAALAISGATANAHAKATISTGNDLLFECTREDAFSQGTCLGYLIGAQHVLNWWQIQKNVCWYNIPDGVTNQQFLDMTVQHLQIFPAQRSEPAEMIVSHVLMRAWPCGKGS